jgi:hypothetical protein
MDLHRGESGHPAPGVDPPGPDPRYATGGIGGGTGRSTAAGPTPRPGGGSRPGQTGG